MARDRFGARKSSATNPDIDTRLSGGDEHALATGIMAGDRGPAASAAPGTLSVSDVSDLETHGGAASFFFLVDRADGTDGVVEATWTLTFSGGAGFADSDDFDGAQSMTGTVHFDDGQPQQLIEILVRGDMIIEPDETFTLTLSAPTNGATLGDAVAIGTIQNDDFAPTSTPPTIDLDGPGGTADYATAYTEGGTGVAIVDSDVAIVSTDGVITDVTVTITDFVAGDEFVLSTPNPSVHEDISYNFLTPGVVHITGGGAAQAADFELALTYLRYRHNGDNPTLAGTDTARILSFTVTDAGGTSNSPVTTIALTAVNDPAIITGTDSGSVTEDSGAGQAAAGTLNASDPDMDVTAFQSADLVGTYGGFELQTNGGWTYTLNNGAANVQALAGGQQVTDIFTIHSADGTAHNVVIAVNGANDAPVVDLNGAGGGTGSALTYTENGVATPISPSATVSDVDSANFFGGTLTVTFTAGGAAEDRLTILGGNGISFSANVIRYNGVDIATWANLATHDGLSPLVITLEAGSTPAAVQALLRAIAYANISEDPNTIQRQLTITISDGDGGTSTAAIATVNVLSVDDAPSGADKIITFTEDTTYTFATADFGYSDNLDHDTFLAVRISSLPLAGTLRLNGIAVSAGDFVAVSEIAAGHLTYAPAPNGAGNGYATFNFQVQDDGTTANGGVDLDQSPNAIVFNVTNLNDTSVIDLNGAGGGTGSALTYTENGAAAAVAPLATLGDPDATLFGEDLTISFTAGGTAADRLTILGGNGISFSANVIRYNGVDIATWVNTTTYDGLTPLVIHLEAGATPTAVQALLRAIAYSNVSDTPSTTPRDLSFVISGNSATSNTAHATINLTPVNDRPEGVDHSLDVPVSGIYTFKVADFSFTDPEGHGLLGVTISSLPATGTIRFLGSPVSPGMQIGADNIAAGLLTYEPAAGASIGDGYASFGYIVTDNGGLANSGQDTDDDANTITIDLVAANMAPTVANPISDQHSNEDAAVNYQVPANSFFDADGDTLQYSAALAGGGALPGWLLFDANTRTFSGTPPANFNGTLSVRVTASDGEDSVYDDFDLIIDPVNDAPSGTDNMVSTAEDTAYTFTAADFGFTDPNDSPPNTLLAVKITTLPGFGTLVNNNVPVTAGDFISLANINSGLLRFVPPPDGNGSPYATFTFQVQDNGGGADLDPTPNTMTLNVTGVNDAPVNTVPGAQLTAEDTAITFSAGNSNQISIADVDAGANPLKVTLTASNGTITLSTTSGLSFITGDGTGDVTMMFTGTAAAINTALNGLSFTPTANYSGAAQIEIVTNDQGNNGAGGPQTDTDTIDITVAAVNDAPSGTDNTVSTAEDAAYTFTAADFGFSDANDTPPNTLLAVKITALPASGVLLNNGVPVNAGDFISIAIINGGLLKFVPPPDGNGSPYATFTFQVQDNGGGTDLDPTPNTMTLNVTGVNDAPVNSVPGAQATNEDSARIFSSANGNQISIADVDAGANPLKVTLTVVHGTLTLSTTAGLSFITGDGTNDVTMMFTGTAAAINAALNGLSYLPATDYHGPDQLQIVTNDQGNSGAGGPQTDTDTVDINVPPVNDAPVNNVGGTASGNEDAAIALTGISIGDVDGLPGDTYTVSLSVQHGTLTILTNVAGGITGANIIGGGNGTNGLTLTGTLAQINATLAAAGGLTYQGDLNYNGSDGLRVSTWEGVPVDAASISASAPLATAAQPIHLITGDINGDGRLDLVYTIGTAGQVAYRLGNGDTTFGPEVALTGANGASSVAVGDVDGDGNVDIVVANYAGAVGPNGFVGVYYGTGGGAFGSLQSLGNMPQAYDVTLADMNNDGRLDVVADRRDVGNSWVYLQTATPRSFVAPAIYSNTPGNYTKSILTGDFNNDGLTDLVAVNPGSSATGNPPGSVTIRFGTGGGALTTLFNVANSAFTNIRYWEAAAADINNDGNLDLVVSSIIDFQGFTVYLGDGTGNFANGVQYATGGNTTGIQLRDINGDGIIDALFTTQGNPGATGWRLGNGNGTFQAAVAIPGGFNPESVAVGDFDGDGDLDFASVAQSDGTLRIFTNNTTNLGDTDVKPITVNPVNDAPAGGNGSATFNEDTSYAFSAADFGFSDTADGNGFLSVIITTLPANGTLTLGGNAVSAGQEIPVGQIGTLVFTPAPNANGNGYASFTFQVRDDGGTANGGIDTDQSANTFTLNVTPVNDAPAIDLNGGATGTGSTATFTENGPTAVLASAATVVDIDMVDFDTGTLTVTILAGATIDDSLSVINQGNGAGQIGVSGATISYGGTAIGTFTGGAGTTPLVITFNANASLTAVQALVRDIGFAVNSENPIGATRTIRFSLTDGDGGTSNNANANVTVFSVNDAPSGTDHTVTTVEDNGYTFTRADFGFSDPAEGNAFVAVTITTLPANGTLTLNGNAVQAGAFILTSAIDAGQLVFTPAANANGNGYASFTFQVVDGGGTLNGGQDTDQSPNTMSVDVTAVNDAPVLDPTKSPLLTAINEDAGVPVGTVGTLVSNLVDFASPAGQVDNVSDPDSGALLGIAITGFNAGGTLYYSLDGGANWTLVGGPFSDSAALLLAADANTRVYFRPGADFSGTVTDAVTFRAWDQTSGTAGSLADTTVNGGSSAFSAASDTVSLTVNPINDAPTLDLNGAGAGVNNAVSYVENAAPTLLAAAAVLGDIDSPDFNGGSVRAEVVVNPQGSDFLQVVNQGSGAGQIGVSGSTISYEGTQIGTLTATGNSGLLIVSLNANATVAAVQALTRALAYFAPSEAPPGGSRGIAISIADGDGGTVTRTSTVTVTSVNDAPQGIDSRVTGLEDTPYVFKLSDFQYSDPEGNALLGVKITALPGFFTLFLDSDGPGGLAPVAVTAGQIISAVDIAAGHLFFQPTASLSGDDFAVFTFQVQDDGGTANGGVDLDPTPNTMTIDIVAVDDPAVAQPDAFTITEAGTIVGANLFASNGFGPDTDPDGPALSISAVNGSAGNVGSQIVLASGALLTVNANGTFNYNPNGAFDSTPTPGSGASNTPGHDGFTYTVAGGNTVNVNITLTGLDTNDLLLGTAGADVLIGGNGNDTYYVENASDQVIEAAGGGNDQVRASVSYALNAGAEVETLSTTNAASTAAIGLTGNAFGQTLIGNAGNNFMDGGGGADILNGGAGDDVIIVDADDQVVEAVGGGNDLVAASTSYALNAGAAVETLMTVYSGGIGAIGLTGNEFGQTLVGNAGNNFMDGGGGADILNGGAGDDVIIVDADDQVVEANGGGNDLVAARASYALNAGAEVETLMTVYGGSTAAIGLTGNEFGQTLIGNAGNNFLAGGGGADILNGGAGDDVIIVDSDDQVVEAIGGGNDLVAALSSYALNAGAEVEILCTTNSFANGAIGLTGNAFGQTILGNAGNNFLNGGGGADSLNGGAGNDVIIVDSDDLVVEAAGGGNDLVAALTNYALSAGAEVETLSTTNSGGNAAINLTGNEFGQSLLGNAGTNILDGGLGADTLTGGGGADSFTFSTALGGGNVDAITDFVHGTDRIALDDAIFGAGIGTPGAFNVNAFVLGTQAGDADDRIIYNSATGQLLYDADGAGGSAAVLFATIQPGVTVTAGDFLVI